MWFFLVILFGFSSAFPWGGVYDQVQLMGSQGIRRHSLFPPSPFLGQIYLPSVQQVFMPLQTFGTGNQRCLLIPLMRAYTVKVCSSDGTPAGGGNFREISKEIIKELEKKGELLDNTNIEVNGKEVEPGNFVKKEDGNGVDRTESKVEDKDVKTKNKIMRVSEEIIQISNEKNDPQLVPDLWDKNFDVENLSITSNLV